MMIARTLPIIDALGSGPTWSDHLNTAGKKLFGASFLGAFPPHKQPGRKDVVPGSMWLWNTNARTGEHWGSTGIMPNGKRLSYDSFGRNDNLVKNRKKMYRRDYALWSDPDIEQNLTSDVCGPISLAWLSIFKEDPELARTV